MPKIDFFDELARPFQRAGRNNNYEVFCSIKDRYGVYIFQDCSDNTILYIGEAYKQDLKDRITQNYNDSSGGDFKKNWCEMNGKNSDDFKTAMNGWRIITMSVASRSSGNWIHALEAVLIGLLQPKYNKT